MVVPIGVVIVVPPSVTLTVLVASEKKTAVSRTLPPTVIVRSSTKVESGSPN